MSEQDKTKTTVPPETFDDEVEEFTAENMPFQPSYLTKMNQFIEKEQLDDSFPTYYLYKFENYYTGKKNSLIDRFEDTPPDEHDIGMKHGSGRYLLFCTVPNCKQFPNGTTRAYRFRVNPIYDERREEFQKLQRQQQQQQFIPAYPQQLPAPQANNGNNIAETFGLIEKIVSIITPLLNQKKDESTGMREVISESYSVVGEIMRTSMMEQMKMMQQFTKQQIKLPDMSREQEPEPPSIIQQFLPIISEWLPKLMGNGPSAAMAGTLVKSIPQFKGIIDDSAQLNAIVQWMCEAHGIEATAQVLTNLGIPFEMPQQLPGELPPDEIQQKDIPPAATDTMPPAGEKKRAQTA